MSAFDRLELPEPNQKKYVFIARKLFAELVYDTAALEDSPYTFPEVQTLLDGITVGGHKLDDQQLVLNQAQSWQRLLGLIEQGGFAVTKDVFCELHALVAKEEALTWGQFRDGRVSIAGTEYQPPEPDLLDILFQQAVDNVQHSAASLHQKAFEFFFARGGESILLGWEQHVAPDDERYPLVTWLSRGLRAGQIEIGLQSEHGSVL